LSLDFAVIAENWRFLLLQGLFGIGAFGGGTVALAVPTIVLGFLLGIIVALGRHAAQTLLNTTTPISRLRGVWAEYHGIRLMPSFHPAYLLRSPTEKRKCWEDLQKVMAEYERRVGPLPRKPAAAG